jgi:hypothetical protein
VSNDTQVRSAVELTVGERLHRARSRRFVGREAELELVRAALEASPPPFAVLFVHGPGGVGKSALLRAIGDVARAAGVRAAGLDLRAVEPSPAGFCRALAEPLQVSEDDVRQGRLGAGRCVVLLDTYELAGALDAWLRDALVPVVPAGTLVVIAGREAPGAGWMTDPGWRDLMRVVSLRNLAPDDARALLEAGGVPECLHDPLVQQTHGHPLALSLMVDVLAQPGPRDGAPALDPATAPDVVRALLERIVGDAPSAQHRRALEVCARARSTTEGLLRAALEVEDAGELFGWLRRLSFVEEGRHGVFPHDLARDVLAADARWRDPEGYARLHARVHDHVVARLSAPDADRGEVVGDLVFLHRDNPFTARFWDWRRFGDAYADGLRPGDRAALLAMAERHEGVESAALVAHWLERQPGGFLVFRAGGGRPIGFAAVIALHAATDEDRAADPGARAMWDFAQRNSPQRPGEEVHAARFFMDDAAYQDVASRSLNALTIATTKDWLARRNPAWELLGPWAQPDEMAGLMAYIEFEPAPEAGYEVGGRRYGVYAHDWRRMGAERWLELMGDREAARGFDPTVADHGAGPVLALSQDEFAHAVRQALRDLQRPDALAASVLARTRMVRDRDHDAPRGEVLEALLREAVAALRAHPRDGKLHRALDRTYVRPAPTQERAAELLDLPLSTYRRHLARGVERVAEWLWQRELYGG